MYLRQRLPLPVNSSPGMIVHRNHSRSKSENAAFISEIIKLVIKYKSHVENNELNEQSTGQLAGSHLCMAQARIPSHESWHRSSQAQVISGQFEVVLKALNPFQYKQIFKRYRKAGKNRDAQLYRRSEYFLILSDGIFYRPVIEDLESQIAWIYTHKVETNKVPILTSDDRRTWAKNLQELIKCKL